MKGTRVYAGAWVFDPTSKPDDGLFELVPFAGTRDWASTALLHVDGNPITEKLLKLVGIEHSKGFRFREPSMRLAPEARLRSPRSWMARRSPGRIDSDRGREAAIRWVIPRKGGLPDRRRRSRET